MCDVISLIKKHVNAPAKYDCSCHILASKVRGRFWTLLPAPCILCTSWPVHMHFGHYYANGIKSAVSIIQIQMILFLTFPGKRNMSQWQAFKLPKYFQLLVSAVPDGLLFTVSWEVFVLHDCTRPWDREIDCLPLPFVCSAPEVLLVSHLTVFL